jgi:DNA-binding NarL/FixJ family response regulator
MSLNNKKIKILIADCHCIVRFGIKMALQNYLDNMHFIEVESDDEVLSAARDHSDIDIFILDYYLPNHRATKLLAELKNSYPDIPVIFISDAEDYSVIKNTIDKGASGLISINTPPQIIVQAVNLVLAGGTYIPKSLPASTYYTSQTKPGPGLTNRQLEILNLIANGYTDKRIANKLDVSHHTVKTHVTCVRNLLGARNRTMAVENARKLGLIR